VRGIDSNSLDINFTAKSLRLGQFSLARLELDENVVKLPFGNVDIMISLISEAIDMLGD
jgi:hypothetical protein